MPSIKQSLFVMEREMKPVSTQNTRRFASVALGVSSLLFVLVAGLTSNCQVMRREAISQPPANQTSSPAPKAEQKFVEKSHTNARGETMPYLLFVPEGYDKTKQYPLVLWLHGGGTRGNDLKLLLAHGDQHGIGFLARADNQAKYPSFIVAPQCPQNRFWADSDSDRPTAETRLVVEILDRVREDFSVDSRRLYVMGMSLVGMGPGILLPGVPRLLPQPYPSAAEVTLLKHR